MLAIVALLLGAVSAQEHQCMYSDGRYNLNLTEISGWRLEYQAQDFFFYYSPCRNGEPCQQGNANFQSNVVQYKPGVNACAYYLSVDHHQSPTYLFGTASWVFDYQDGEMCEQTQQPRRTDIFYLCDEFMQGGAYLYDAQETQLCRYALTVRSPAACIPENSHNANCQWRYHDQENNTYSLDLSALKGRFIHGPQSQNGYEQYYSPCGNALHCYQQTGGNDVMSISENRVTGTCERYLSVWQEGRVQPIFHNNNDPNDVHWSFHYYLAEKCSDGTQGEQTIRWYCDNSVGNFSVINATYDGGCRWEMNLKSAMACPSNDMYHMYDGLDLRKVFSGVGQKAKGYAKKIVDRLIG